MSNQPEKSSLWNGITRDAGKKVIDWTFHSSREISATVEVRIVGARRGEPMHFEASCAQLQKPLTDTDINVLFERVKDALDRQDDINRGITWETWLEVKVHGHNTDPLMPEGDPGAFEARHSASAGLSLGYTYIRRGSTTTGKVFAINCNGIIAEFPKPTTIDDPATHGSGFRFRENEEVAYVPATPANIAALEALREQMAAVRSRIASLMSQENLVKTLHLAASAQPLQLGGS